MTSRTDFSDEEWQPPRRAPFRPPLANLFPRPRRPPPGAKEKHAPPPPAPPAAAARGGGRGSTSAAPPPFPGGAAGGGGGLAGPPPQKAAAGAAHTRHNPMSGFKPRGADARREIEDEMRAVNALLVEKT